MTLGEKQEKFARDWGHFIVWFHTHSTWRMRIQEGFVGLTDGADGDYDGPHLQGGAHYTKLGVDFAFFLVNGPDRIQLTGDHPFWYLCAAEWKSLDPENRWGGDFTIRDYNHFSRIHEGVM